MIIVIHFTGPYLVRIFVDGSQTDVLNASMVYFKTVAWCYPFLGSIFLYRNALQGLGYGLVPMLGGVFELAARFAVVAAVVRPFGYVGVCFADPAAWLAARIPLWAFPPAVLATALATLLTARLLRRTGDPNSLRWYARLPRRRPA